MVKHARRKSATRAQMARTGRSFTAQTRAHQGARGATYDGPSADDLRRMAVVGTVVVSDPATGLRQTRSIDTEHWMSLAQTADRGVAWADLRIDAEGTLAPAQSDPVPFRTVHSPTLPAPFDPEHFAHFEDCVPWLRFVVREDGTLSSDDNDLRAALTARALRLHREFLDLYREWEQEMGGDRVEVEQTWPVLTREQRIVFKGEQQAWRVRAVSASGRYVVLTRGSRYCLVDLALGVRGTDDHYGMGYSTDERCENAARALEAGEAVVSLRNWTWLRLADQQPDEKTARMLPLLRAAVIVSPPRRYNEKHNGSRLDSERLDRGQNPLPGLLEDGLLSE